MSYTIRIEKLAEKFIMKLARPEKERVLKAIHRLPDEGDIKKMKGHDDLLRLRVGDYRVVYKVDNDKIIVIVIDAGSRGDIYKRY